MGKVSEERERFERLSDQVYAHAKGIGIERYGPSNTVDSRKGEDRDKFGICLKCAHFAMITKEYSGDIASCWHYECRLLGDERIIECTGFSPKGQLRLEEMLQIATLIEVPSNKRMGF